MPDPTDPCKQLPTDHTVPLECASFIWTAVQRLKAKGVPITLDLDVPGEPVLPAGCQKLIPSQRAGDAPDPKLMTPDGLYYYSITQRHNAGQAVFQLLHDQVVAEIQQQLDHLFDALDEKLKVKVSRAAWGALAIALGSGLGPLGTLLGIGVADAQSVADLLTGMPDHIANQICNAFANDNQKGADEKSKAWQNSGEGRAVSPDNIVWFWDPTTFVAATASSAAQFKGLYGQNRELALRPAMWGDTPKCQWQVSPGPAVLRGQVVLAGSSGGVDGAVVTCACRQTWSNVDGYSMEVPAGVYWATASWKDPGTGMVWSAAEQVDVVWPGGTNHKFTLTPPPVAWRQIEIHGHADMVDAQAISSDDISSHPTINLTAHMGPFGKPSDPSDTSGRLWERTVNLPCGDESTLQIHIQLSWQSVGIIRGSLGAIFKNKSDSDASAASPALDPFTFTMNPGAILKMPVTDFNSNEPAPFVSDRAALGVTFTNRQQL